MPGVDRDSILEKVTEALPAVRQDLEALVRIPSISAEGFDPAEVRRSAEEAADILSRAGLEAELLEVDGAHPAVLGRIAAPRGAPTVLLYAHHDVQPTGPVALWSSPPFEPVERDGRLYGRGTTDDKAGILAHAAAVRAWEGRPPVGVTVFLEGEEEVGSEHLGEFLARYGASMRADAVVVADASNWRLEQPGLTTSLRGLVDCVVEVRTLDHAVHSGMYGGPVPDALSALARVLASLHDDRGNVAVPGLASGAAEPLDLTEEDLRGWVGLRPGVELIGEGALTERLWMKPSISVLGVDAPAIRDATNQLVPSARAKVSLRLAPGDEPARAMDSLAGHLRRNAPWGAEIHVHPGAEGRPYAIDARGPAFDAFRSACAEVWGVPPVDIGTGGSIPFVAALAEAFPGTPLLLTGVEDPEGNAHSENESLHLAEFARICQAEALLLGQLADQA